MPEAQASDKLNVFISYSRDDLNSADQLDDALQLTGFATTIDRHGIPGGEEWRARLAGLIRDADTVVFVLSPTSASLSKAAACSRTDVRTRPGRHHSSRRHLCGSHPARREAGRSPGAVSDEI
jgi:hypothetical protein